MEEKTTTEAPVETGAEALPVEAEQTAAVEQTTETEVKPEESGAEALPEEDQLEKFAKSHGLELDSPSARKAAKMAMDNQAEFQRNRQKASELEKTMSTMSDDSAQQVAEVTGQDPELIKRLQRIEVNNAIRDFWDENPGARKYQAEMAKIATEAGLYGAPQAILKAAYAMAAANDPASKSQVKREALESLAHKQQAAVPTGNAINSNMTSKEKPFSELSIAEMEAKLGFVR